jgi:hypothetical protein
MGGPLGPRFMTKATTVQVAPRSLTPPRYAATYPPVPGVHCPGRDCVSLRT